MVAAVSHPLLAPDDDGVLPEVTRRKLEEQLSKTDREFLAYLLQHERIELGPDPIPGAPGAPDEYMVVFFTCHGLVAPELDEGQHAFLVATPVLGLFLEPQPPPKKKRRRRQK